MNKKYNWSVLIGAAFLMATSAIGPGFLTQTAVFTEQLGASFGFVILLSILLDAFAQLNVWRIIAVADKPARGPHRRAGSARRQFRKAPRRRRPAENRPAAAIWRRP